MIDFEYDRISNPVEVFVITRDSGLLLHKYTIINIPENPRDQLFSGFLVALNNFAKEMHFPAGVSLIRSGDLEARFSSGEYVFAVLMIQYPRSQSSASTEPILSGLAKDIVDRFEEKYEDQLIKQRKTQKFRPKTYKNFFKDIDAIINQYGEESHELYQKLVLVEGMYANVPQKWCIPLIERIGGGERVDIIKEIPDMYHRRLKKAIKKVNYNSKPVWDIFVVPLIDPSEL
ncbi:MAG: hypothetical protein BAJALOKI1v1_940006 [Promethearchaeota archaeon]|nr:MAG: hypothetical protein BAJALOKI1v1_940006 [Candidatus Lokiarchaeota archaeon]